LFAEYEKRAAAMKRLGTAIRATLSARPETTERKETDTNSAKSDGREAYRELAAASIRISALKIADTSAFRSGYSIKRRNGQAMWSRFPRLVAIKPTATKESRSSSAPKVGLSKTPPNRERKNRP
jgi:hypothetical protein